MLHDLAKDDWLSILDIPAERIPRALLLRGTRNLKTKYERHRSYFSNVLEVGSPNGLLEDVLIGDLDGAPVAYASVYGGPMASEVTHVFGVLGTSLVVQTGCCGALVEHMHAGDLFLPTDAFCGEGAAQYYIDEQISRASLDVDELPVENTADLAVHQGRIYTTAALFAEGQREIEQWAADGWQAVDMETATTFAVAEHFGMDRAAVLYVFDNTREKGDMLITEGEKDRRRKLGYERSIEVSLDILRGYLTGVPANHANQRESEFDSR